MTGLLGQTKMMRAPDMLDDRFSRVAALYCVVAAVVILISTVTSHAGDLFSDIQKNPDIVKASWSSGPCNPNNSVAKRELLISARAAALHDEPNLLSVPRIRFLHSAAFAISVFQ
jgi:hypothetical protein